MTARRIFALIGIYLLGALGWNILGGVSSMRSHSQESTLTESVQNLWGAPILQRAPAFTVAVPGTQRQRAIAPVENRIAVTIDLEPRRKGLLWYSTYAIDFDAQYTLTNTESVAQTVRVRFPLPSQTATYERLQATLDGEPLTGAADASNALDLRELITIAPGASRRFGVHYATRGLNEWRYQLSGDSGEVRSLRLSVQTDFDDIDFAEGSLSPTRKELHDDGWRAEWHADQLITRQDIGIVTPQRLNPGPLSARMSYFAPVCLLFFFVVVSAIALLRRVDIHPMHYLFVTAGFFAFHLLFAYLVDLVNVHAAFVAATITSVGLVTSYLRAALGQRFPWRLAAAGQCVYLVLFSYSFFLKGMTGLTVTIGSILTLAALMYATARLDWPSVFGRRQPA
jgi:hypothetical protein